MKKIILIISYSLSIMFIACNYNSKKSDSISSIDSIISKDTTSSPDSTALTIPQPQIVSFFQSKCINNCNASKLVVGKVLSNDTLSIRLASVIDCGGENTCSIKLTNDTLRFYITKKPNIFIIKKKNKIDTIYSYSETLCDCFFFFDIIITGIHKMPKKFLINDKNFLDGVRVIHDTTRDWAYNKNIDIKEKQNDSLPAPFIVVEEMPSYPGGDDARIKFITDNLNFPVIEKESNLLGTIYVTFVVEPDGTLTNFKVHRGINKEWDEETLRVIKMMPKWNPGKQSGKNVRVQFNLPIRIDFN
jgi:hypothetical protein